MIKDIEQSPVPVLITISDTFIKWRRPLRRPPLGCFISPETKQREFKNKDLPDTFVWVDKNLPPMKKQIVLWHETQHALCYKHNCFCHLRKHCQKIAVPYHQVFFSELHAYHYTLTIILKRQLFEYLTYFVEHAINQIEKHPASTHGKACLHLQNMRIFTVAQYIVNAKLFENQLLFYDPLAKIPVFAAKK